MISIAQKVWLEENDEDTKRSNYVNYYGKKRIFQDPLEVIVVLCLSAALS